MSRKLVLKPAELVVDYDDRTTTDLTDEFVRQRELELRVTVEDDDDEFAEKTLATVHALELRLHDPSIEMADICDSHSQDAHEVESYLRLCSYEGFEDRFETGPDYSRLLLVQAVDWPGASPEELRCLVGRTVDQFDVDLVLVPADAPFADAFVDYFDRYPADAPYLVHPCAYTWPTETLSARRVRLALQMALGNQAPPEA